MSLDPREKVDWLNSAPPLDYWEHLHIEQLIKAVSMGMVVIIKKNFFHHAMREVGDRLDGYELQSFKRQVSISDSFFALILRKRIKFLGTTGPVKETDNG